MLPCGNSNDTSMLVQSLDSLRTHNSWHGHLLASWHRCHAGKGWAPGKVVAHPRSRLSRENGQRVRSASQRCAQPPRAGLWLWNFILITDLMMWTLSELSQLFIFHFLSAAGQVTDSMWLNGYNPAGRRKQGTLFPGNSGRVTGEPYWFRQQNIKRVLIARKLN